MKPKLLFIHRSVGHNLIHDGKVYELVEEAGNPFSLSDYDQNTDTLTTGGKTTAAGWRFPGNDTTPADYAALFSQDKLKGNDTTLQTILGYDIIAIKSCFPNTRIRSNQALEAAEDACRHIAAFFRQLPDKKLIVLTSPPLIPLLTLPPFAGRARTLANWLSRADLGANIFVFDFFNELAVPEGNRQANTLRREYRRRFPLDSHPNALAGRAITPKLVAFFERVANS